MGGGWSRNPKIRFHYPRRLRGRARPSDMSGSRGGVCPSFCNGYFANLVHRWLPAVTLDSWWSLPEAKHSAKRQGRARVSSNLKFGFGALEDPGAVRVPPTCEAVRKWCVLAFAMVSLPIRFARGHLRPPSALGGWAPEALHSAKKRVGPGEAQISKADLEP